MDAPVINACMIGEPVVCRPFIARRQELAILENARRALAHSRGGVVLVAGETGIGKSRLLAEFLRGAVSERRARRIARTECLEYAQRPFGVFRELFDRLGADDIDDSSGFAALAQIAGRPAGPPLEKADLFAALASHARSGATKRATIFAIDDLHWADPSSLEALTYFAPRCEGSRLLIVATYRSEALAASADVRALVERLARSKTVRTIELDVLDGEATRAVIDGALVGHDRPTEPTLHAIAQRCGGNPFYAEELLKSALVSRSSGSGVPQTIKGTIRGRLTLLDARERALLGDAALLGPAFDPTLLAAVTGEPIDRVFPALARSRDLNLLIEDRDTGRFHFRHALTRETIYEHIVEGDARRSHARILAVLEALENVDPYLDELAYHAWRAGDLPKTIAYNERSARAAVQKRALPEARTGFERAVDAASGDDRIRLLEAHGEVLLQLGERERAVTLFETALNESLARDRFDDAARLLVLILGESSNSGHGKLIFPRADAFLALYENSLGVAAHGRLFAFLGVFAAVNGEYERADVYVSGIAEPQALPARVRHNYLHALLNLEAARCDIEGWRKTAQACLAFSPDQPPFLRAIAAFAIVQTGLPLNADDVVDLALREGERIVAEWGFSALADLALALRGTCAAKLGRLADARTAFRKALGLAPSAVTRTVLAMMGPRVALHLDDAQLAERCMDEALLLDARSGTISSDDALMLIARAAFAASRGEHAASSVDARLALRSIAKATPYVADVLLIGAELLDGDDFAYARCLAVAERERGLPMRALATMLDALHAARSGDPQAPKLADAAAEAYRELKRPLQEARALELAGRNAEAAALYRACGAAADAERLQPHLGNGIAARDAASLGLSRREREIALLVTAGATNDAIAQRLSLRPKTIEKHLTNVFAKLGVRSRAALAANVARQETRTAREP